MRFDCELQSRSALCVCWTLPYNNGAKVTTHNSTQINKNM